MVQKIQFVSLLYTKKKFKNDQDVCWLEHDYMEMKIIVRDQSKNYFPLTPQIGPLCESSMSCSVMFFFYIKFKHKLLSNAIFYSLKPLQICTYFWIKSLIFRRALKRDFKQINLFVVFPTKVGGGGVKWPKYFVC